MTSEVEPEDCVDCMPDDDLATEEARWSAEIAPDDVAPPASNGDTEKRAHELAADMILERVERENDERRLRAAEQRKRLEEVKRKYGSGDPKYEQHDHDEGEALDESWQPVDLGPALAGELHRPEPTILRRDDKVGTVYAGRVNGLHGDSGIGKSYVAGVAGKDEIDAGNHVVWVDLEDPDAMTVIGRLRDDFGLDPDTIRERFHYYGPTEPFGELPLQEVERAIGEHAPTLVVIDSVGEAFGLEGIDENKDSEVGPWMRRVARRLADAGPAVLLLDHSTKGADNPLHPSGSKRKRAAITGASFLVEARRPLIKGAGGVLTLTCAKDRHGTHRTGDVAAILEFTVYPDGGMTVHVEAPSAEAEKDTRIYFAAQSTVAAAKAADRPLSQNSLETLMQIKASVAVKRAGIEAAVARHAISVTEGTNRSKLHTYVRDLNKIDKEALLA